MAVCKAKFDCSSPASALSILVDNGSLAPADFSGAVFTSAHFQKIAQISSLCNFEYISEGIPSLICFLVTNDLTAVDLVHAGFWQT